MEALAVLATPRGSIASDLEPRRSVLALYVHRPPDCPRLPADAVLLLLAIIMHRAAEPTFLFRHWKQISAAPLRPRGAGVGRPGCTSWASELVMGCCLCGLPFAVRDVCWGFDANSEPQT